MTTAQWEIPYKPANAILRQIAGGWQMNAMNTIESGRPIALSASVSGSGGNRPNVNPGVSYQVSSQSLYQWFNNTSCTLDPARAAFCQPAPYTYGNVGRTLPDINGPKYFNLDYSLFKTFPLTEKYKLQFRAEAFNLTNTPQFEVPTGSISSATFGMVTATITPAHTREIQFALRLSF